MDPTLNQPELISSFNIQTTTKHMNIHLVAKFLIYCLKSSASLLCGDWLLDSLGTSVCLVDLCPLGHGSGFKIPAVEGAGGVLLHGSLNSSEVLVHGDGSLGLVRLSGSLGGGLDNQNGAIVLGALNVVDLRVGKSRVLELVEVLDVSLFGREGNRTSTLRVTVLLVQERRLVLGELPNERIRAVYHFDVM
jgi:hypothetical protein